MNHGILFEVNGICKHSSDDWGLILSPVEIPYPEPKTRYVEIDGGNGSIDLTETFGKIYYKDRTFSITFECSDRLRYDSQLQEIAAFLHGREVKCTFYFDQEYYYKGRITFNKYTSSKSLGEMTFSIVVDPYKYKRNVTIAINKISTKKIVVYKNDRMEVTPIFKADSPMTFEFKGNLYSLSTHETIFADVEFKEGDNVIVWRGNGTVSVTYQEGAF